MKARMAALQIFVLTASMITWIIYDEGACADASFVFVTQIATCHHSLLQGSIVWYSHCPEVIICSLT